MHKALKLNSASDTYEQNEERRESLVQYISVYSMQMLCLDFTRHSCRTVHTQAVTGTHQDHNTIQDKEEKDMSKKQTGGGK